MSCFAIQSSLGELSGSLLVTKEPADWPPGTRWLWSSTANGKKWARNKARREQREHEALRDRLQDEAEKAVGELLSEDVVKKRRIAKLLGMLGSAHDGEVLNAAKAIEAYRKDGGETWEEVLGIAPIVIEPPRRRG